MLSLIIYIVTVIIGLMIVYLGCEAVFDTIPYSSSVISQSDQIRCTTAGTLTIFDHTMCVYATTLKYENGCSIKLPWSLDVESSHLEAENAKIVAIYGSPYTLCGLYSLNNWIMIFLEICIICCGIGLIVLIVFIYITEQHLSRLEDKHRRYVASENDPLLP